MMQKLSSPTSQADVAESLLGYDFHKEIKFHVRSENDQGGTVLSAHAAILCQVSQLISNLWNKMQCTCSAELCKHQTDLHISLDGVSHEDLVQFLEVLYMGKTMVTSDNEQIRMSEVAKMLEINVNFETAKPGQNEDEIAIIDDEDDILSEAEGPEDTWIRGKTVISLDAAFDDDDDDFDSGMGFTGFTPEMVSTPARENGTIASFIDLSVSPFSSPTKLPTKEEITDNCDGLVDGSPILNIYEDITHDVSIENVVDSCRDCGKDFDDNDTKSLHDCPLSQMLGEPDPTTDAEDESGNFGHGGKRIREQLTCHICGRDFGLKLLLKSHVTSHFQEELFKKNGDRRECNLCKKSMKSRNGLTNHLGWDHEMLRDFIDNDTFDLLNKNNQMEDIPDKKAKNNGKKAKRKEDKKKAVKKFKKTTKKDREQDNREPENEITEKDSIEKDKFKKICIPEYVCFKCNKKFHKKLELRSHLSITHFKQELLKLNGKSDTKCHNCHSDYKTPSKLVKHLALKHFHLTKFISRNEQQEVYQPIKRKDHGAVANTFYQCCICDYQTHGVNHVKYHLTTHFSAEIFKLNQKDKAKCLDCGHTFTNKTHLLVHVAFVHNKIGQFMTEEQLRSAFVAHPKVHKDGKDALKDITNSINIKTEGQETTSEEPGTDQQENDEKMLQCDYCNYSDDSVNKLEFHVASHFKAELLHANGLNKNSCELCGQLFRGQMTGLLHHLAYSHELINPQPKN